MNDKLDAPVIAYRRWSVTGTGRLTGLGIPVEWTPGMQTARCEGKHPVAVAEYCDPPESKPADAYPASDYIYDRQDRGPWLLPDGRWVRTTQRMSCRQTALLPVEHPSPSLHSRCGIWAHKQPIADCACSEPGADYHGAVGVVRMWGRAVEHTDGWRAEHAEVVALVDHSDRLSGDYDVPRYRTTTDMYAEWTPDRHGWAARHDPYWCDPYARMRGQLSGRLSPSVPSSLIAQMMTWGTAVQPYVYGGPISAGFGISYAIVDEVHADPMTKALEDKKTRNANHPAQDRPEKSKRRRFPR